MRRTTFALAALSLAMAALGLVGAAGADVNPVTPSTNDVNRSLGWAHVDVTTGPGTADLQFISTRNFYSCFEYRTDGDTSQKTSDTNFNSDITDGLYPYKCEFNSTHTVTIAAKKYLEVRMVFGAETDERFDWTRFDVGQSANVIFSSVETNGPPSNMPSYGAEAYAFNELGSKIEFATNGPRHLTNVTVTLSSWACVEGNWFAGDCYTPSGSTFDLPMTLKIYAVGEDGMSVGDVLAESSETFSIPYRPSASAKCEDGKWYSAGLKTCFNGLADDVTFGLGGQDVTLPDEVVFGISYDTSHFGYEPTGVSGPYDSLNIAVNTAASVGGFDHDALWVASGIGALAPNPGFDGGDGAGYVPAVQFKAGAGGGG